MNRNALILLVLFAAMAVSAEIANFALKREIVGAETGWRKIVLPDDIYAKVSGGMTDLRIAGERANGERFEVPYLLRQTAEAKEATVDFKTVNQVAGDGGRLITFEVPTAETVNQIDLSFGLENFDWRVRLEGSSDQKQWFKILEDYRIVAFKNKFTSYTFTTLRFPDAKYKYLRLFIPVKKDPGFGRASIMRTVSNREARRRYPVKSFKVTEDKTFRVSVIDVELENKVPLDFLKVNVADKIDFYRPISVEYVAGSNADNQPVYTRGAADIVSSFDPNGFRFPVFVADKLRISVSNQDNPPLTFESFEIAGTTYELVAQFPESAKYILLYSKPDTPKPQYDLANFKDKVPDGLPELTLGPQQINDDYSPAGSPVSSPIWLWPVMIVAIAIMGFFAFRMLRK
ncbi:MAG TPA: DUF3999 family protein [Pyrinomonadaceae bacterium]|nr:DUF3999 family protein [Pyrinomonadaceae bacterium]